MGPKTSLVLPGAGLVDQDDWERDWRATLPPGTSVQSFVFVRCPFWVALQIHFVVPFMVRWPRSKKLQFGRKGSVLAEWRYRRRA